MEVKIVNVRAEKMRDGKIVYLGNNGKRPKRKIQLVDVLGGIIAVWCIMAMLFFVIMLACGDISRNDHMQRGVDMEPHVSHEQAMQVVGLCNLVMELPNDEVDATDDKVEMLALVIYQEAGGDSCSDDTRRMVGEVAMNRVADSRFPDTLEEVLLQKQQYGRLYWTGLVWPERASNPGEAHAVQRAYDIARLVLTSDERLLPNDVVFQAEFRQGTETVAESDGFYFCR